MMMRGAGIAPMATKMGSLPQNGLMIRRFASIHDRFKRAISSFDEQGLERLSVGKKISGIDA
jgi:hypothetical protein